MPSVVIRLAALAACGLLLASCSREVAPQAVIVVTETATTDPVTTTAETTATTPETTPETTEETTTTTEDETTTTSEVDSPAGSYEVTISGMVSGYSFSRPAQLTVRSTISSTGTTNGVNPVDVCLISGFPAAQPQPGALWFSSNSACEPSAGNAQLDLGTVTVNGNTLTLEPDETIAATGNNLFTSSSGIAACPFMPTAGSMSVTIEGGNVSGSLDLSGYGGAFCGNSEYHATIS